MADPSRLPRALWAPSSGEPLGGSPLQSGGRARWGLPARPGPEHGGLGNFLWGARGGGALEGPRGPRLPSAAAPPSGPRPPPPAPPEAPGGGAPPGPGIAPAAHTHGDSGATILRGGRSGRGLLGLH